MTNSVKSISFDIGHRSMTEGIAFGLALILSGCGSGSDQPATNGLDNNASELRRATAAITIAPNPAPLIYGGQTQQFSASANSLNSSAVTWKLSYGLGAISSTGLYTAPADQSGWNTVVVIATSTSSPALSAQVAQPVGPTSLAVGSTGGASASGGSTGGASASGGSTGGASASSGSTGGASASSGSIGSGSTGSSISSSPVYTGINIDNVASWTSDLLFVDLMKTSGLNGSPKQDPTTGWPLEDSSFFVAEGALGAWESGVYKLSFQGQATVGASSFSVSNQKYDATTNTTTADLSPTSGNSATLSFAATKQTASSAQNTGISNIKLIKPGYTTADTFQTPIKNLIAMFGVIRFMDYSAINWNQQANWSDRTLPNYYTQVPPAGTNDGGKGHYGWEGKGAAWEYAIQLANETGKDMWITVPHAASDDYVTKLATLIRDGNPALGFSPLRSDLAVYVEFGNEMWNSSFGQAEDSCEAANQEVFGGGTTPGTSSPLNYDNVCSGTGYNGTCCFAYAWTSSCQSSNPNICYAAHTRRVARRSMEISNIFRSVFGDAQMMTRVRPVLESQQGYPDGTLAPMLSFLDNYYNNGDGNHVANPHPPSYFFYGGGGSAYSSPANSDQSLTLSSIWTSETMSASNWAPTCQRENDWTAAYGLKRLAYEGGPGMDSDDGKQGDALDAVKTSAWADPRMTASIVAHQQTYSQNGGDLLVYFQSTWTHADGYYQWSFTDNVANLSTPKLLGIAQLKGQSTPFPLTYGTQVPATISVSSPSVKDNAWNSGVVFGKGYFYAYTIRVVTAGTFSVSVDYQSSGTSDFSLKVDGSQLAAVNLNSGSGTTTTYPITLGTGLHSVSFRVGSGNFSLSQIHVS